MKKNWYVGIDVSKKWLDAAIFVENSDLKGYIHTQVSNDKQGCRELLRWLREHDVDASTCTYGMEHTGFYSDGLQHFLDKKGYRYTMLEPAVIKHYPIQPREKNDRLDAAKIADYLYRFKDTVELSRVPDKTMERLRCTGSASSM
ncbi:MAG: transposase IS116/IS110/IS902 family protein [bacterium P201]|nr:MAG: transposase IS116/IS110/IS902 family protein [bacterium P201]